MEKGEGCRCCGGERAAGVLCRECFWSLRGGAGNELRCSAHGRPVDTRTGRRG